MANAALDKLVETARLNGYVMALTDVTALAALHCDMPVEDICKRLYEAVKQSARKNGLLKNEDGNAGVS